MLSPKIGQAAGQVSVPALAKRVAADQLLMAPIGVRLHCHRRAQSVVLTIAALQLTLFIGSMGVMEGRDSNHVKTKFKDMYVPAILANWQVWPLAQVR